MIVAIALAVLAFTDCMLSGFRMAAGRNGSLDKRGYYLTAVGRAAAWGAMVVVTHTALTGLLCATASNPTATWSAFLEAGRILVVVYAVFATAIFVAFGFYFAPIGDFRVLTNVIVFGPLTLTRRAVVVGAMIFAVWRSPEWRVALVAASSTIAMTLFEPILGRRYANQWRELVAGAAPGGSSAEGRVE